MACSQFVRQVPSAAQPNGNNVTHLPSISQNSNAKITPTSPSTTSHPPANAFYVATDGDDDNPGNPDKPWRTIQKAADTVGADSIVYVRGGVYNEQITLNVSGAAEKPIIFQSHPNETAIVDGGGLTFSEEKPALWLINDQSYIVIQDFEIRNYHTNTTGQTPFGIAILGTSHHIELRHNLIHHIEHNGTTQNGTDAHGIAVYGESGTQAIHDIIIDSNELHSLKLGSSEALTINGNVQDWQVTNNIVHDSNNIGIVAIGFEDTAPANDQARDGLIAGNQVYNIDTYGNPAYGNHRSAGCIYVDGGLRIIIERNLAHHCNLGIEVASEHAGGAASEVIVRNNFVYNNSDVGLSIGGYDTNVGGAYHCTIINNTFYNNTTNDDAWGSELYIQYDTQDNIIQNNIFFADNDRNFIQSWSDVMVNNQMDYNLFFAPGGGTNGNWEWQGIQYEIFSAYQIGSNNDSASLINQDPLLVSTTDLHLQTNSPAVDKGLALPTSGEVDFDGQPRIHNLIEIGADEVH